MSFLQHAEFRIEGVPNLDYRVVQAVRQVYAQLYALDSSASNAIAQIGNSNQKQSVMIEDTHVNRNLYPAANYALGSQYYETDRTVTYICKSVNAANAWCYQCGSYASVQTSKPTDLGVNDAGFIWEVTDFGHRMRWVSTIWQFDDDGSFYIVAGGANAPKAVGWQKCDGSTVFYLKEDGTTASVTVPNWVAIPAYLEYGSAYSNTVNSATAPGITGTTASGTANITTTPLVVQSGTGSIPINGASDSGHTHAVGSLVVDNTGRPPNTGVVGWFRI